MSQRLVKRRTNAVDGQFFRSKTAVLFLGCSAISLLLLGSVSAQTTLRSTQTSISANGDGSATTFQIRVADANGKVPTGTVTLWSGELSLAAAVLDAEGVATYTASALPPGTRQVSAVYSGDAQHASSVSAAAAVTPAATGVPSFTLAANPAALTIKAGAYGTTVISVIPVNGFDQSVNLSCSGLPQASTCTFSPVNVLVGTSGNPAISTLNIQTLAPSGTGNTGSLREDTSRKPLLAIVIPGAAALIGLALRRKRFSSALRALGAVALLLGCGLGLGACAARYNYFHKPPLGNPGTSPGTTTVVISGTGVASSGALVTATTQITVTVQ